MGTYPTAPRSAFLNWCRDHTEIFVGSAAQIGLSSQQALQFRADVDAAIEADLTQSQARQSALTATQIANDKYSQLRARTRATVGLIKAFAEATNNTNVYNIAEIPPPADPSAVPPPGQPTNMKVAIEPGSGALTISWKAINPPNASGTSYIVRRKLPTQTSFEFIGVTGTKKFTDSTLSAGPDSVQYTIQGQRSDSAGPTSDILIINFGRASGGGGGGFVVSSVPSDQNGRQGEPFRVAA
jgi:hypothetical protein